MANKIPWGVEPEVSSGRMAGGVFCCSPGQQIKHAFFLILSHENSSSREVGQLVTH
jgi:hypothetical protein